MPMVLFFSINQNGGTGDDRGWFIFAVIVAAISAITAIGVGCLPTNRSRCCGKTRNKRSSRISCTSWLRTTNCWPLRCPTCSSPLVRLLLNSFELYYFTYVLGNSKAFSILGGLNTVVGVIFRLRLPTVLRKIGRHKFSTRCRYDRSYRCLDLRLCRQVISTGSPWCRIILHSATNYLSGCPDDDYRLC